MDNEFIISDAILSIAKTWLFLALGALALYFIVAAIEKSRGESINVFAIFQKKEESGEKAERVPVEVPEKEEVEENNGLI